MITLVYYYVKKIILFLIFSSFVQVLFLENHYKKYIQLVLNLILVFIIVSPLTEIKNHIKKGNLEEYIKITENDDFKIQEEYYNDIQNKMTFGLLKDSIKSQLQNLIGEKYNILDFDVSLIEDKNYQTKIKNIDLVLSYEAKNVYVSPFKYSDESSDTKKYEQEIKNLKIIISNFYNLSYDNIFITIT